MGKDGAGGRRPMRRRIAAATGLVALLLAIIFGPPYISVQRYKGRIAGLISAALGRPVRLSSVELRLLPRPGFVLTDLTVDEDPAYGAEPVLHANSVQASIRLLSLWHGLEISRISVDEASLNLVRTPEGRWNVESLFRTAAQPVLAAGTRRRIPFPYLEATESRVNFKSGIEKLPYSLVNSDVSFWQEEPGEWRIRLRGQPARTDMTLDMADTGIVRLNADLHRARELRQMPMHVDVEWNEAQLGQLARLLTGSDPGWRGDLTGEFAMDGTPDKAEIKTRLRAAGVHRAEFAPPQPMDFDASCAFLYHYSSRAVDNLQCSSPVGDGRVRFAGSLPGVGAPQFTVEVDRLPVEAVLDALRTVRDGIVPQLDASGTVSGKISYQVNAAPAALHAHPLRTRAARPQPAPPSPLTGSLTVEGLELSSEDLKEPIRLNKVVLEPAPAPAGESAAKFQGLVATANVPAGATAPLTATARLTLEGYQLGMKGQASMPRIRELAQIAGIGDRAALSALTGGAATIDVSARGPWIAPEVISLESADTADRPAGPDELSGTLTLRDAHWKAEYLAGPINIAQATLNLDGGEIRWDPVQFAYGPVKGTASLTVRLRCGKPEACTPKFGIQFGALDAGALEAAILGARKPGTLLSQLIAKLTQTRTPAWPEMEGTVRADSLILGPVTLNQPSADLRIQASGAEIQALDAGLFGGKVHGSGSVRVPGSNGNEGGKPVYALEGEFERLNPAAIGRLLGERWTGGEIEGIGKIELAGYTGEDFASSANGNLHFEWRHGSVVAGAQAAAEADTEDSMAAVPTMLARFDRWRADAAIANGAIRLGENELARGARKTAVNAEVSFGTPARVSFTPAQETQTAKR